MLKFRSSLVALLGCSLLSGCATRFYRAETVLHADGSLERAIYQPTEDTPTEILNSQAWQGRTHAARIETSAWEGNIRKFSPAEQDKDHPYFAAWGKFNNVKELPSSYRKATPDDSQAAVLKPSLTVHDFGFVKQYVWSETLTDIVTQDGMDQARQELAKIATKITVKTLSQTLESELNAKFDLTELEKWLQSEGALWFQELTQAWFQFQVQQSLAPQTLEHSEFGPYAEAICTRHGLKITNGNIDESVARKFLEQKARDLIRKADGSPIDQETINQLMTWIFEESNGEKKSPLSTQFEKVVLAEFGSKEDAEKQLGTLYHQVMGVHSEILGVPTMFEYRMTFPGLIQSTNGSMIDESQVEWRFETKKAYPYGYPMTASSLAPETNLQKQLLGKVVLNDLTSMNQFLMLLQQSEGIRSAVLESVEQKSLQPLNNYREQVIKNAGSEPSSELIITARLWKLLELSQ